MALRQLRERLRMLRELITLHPLITGKETEAQCINLFLFISSLTDPVIMAYLPLLSGL